MTSRLAHLAIIDILSATVQARFGKVFDSRKDEVIKNIEKILKNFLDQNE